MTPASTTAPKDEKPTFPKEIVRQAIADGKAIIKDGKTKVAEIRRQDTYCSNSAAAAPFSRTVSKYGDGDNVHLPNWMRVGNAVTVTVFQVYRG